MNIPEEIYYKIASLVDDLETFYALSVCSKMIYLGCMMYKRQIINKYPLFDIYSYRKPIVLDDQIPVKNCIYFDQPRVLFRIMYNDLDRIIKQNNDICNQRNKYEITLGQKSCDNMKLYAMSHSYRL